MECDLQHICNDSPIMVRGVVCISFIINVGNCYCIGGSQTADKHSRTSYVTKQLVNCLFMGNAPKKNI